jgi:ATP-dependent RNA helicase SUPV3L1/SUV3
MAETRLALWVKAHIQKHLGPLFGLEAGEGATGIARGIAFQLAENLGVLDRQKVAQDVRSLDQNQRGELRKLGVRFGAYHLFLPALMKPGPRSLAAQLHLLFKGDDDAGLKDVSHLAYSGRTSIPVDSAIPNELYRIAGYRVAGPRAIRIDILERLADLIRPAIAYRPGITEGEPPPGTADGDAFVVTGAMTSLVGAAGPDFAEVLKALGYRSESRNGPAITAEIKRAKPPEVAPPESGATELVQAEELAPRETAPTALDIPLEAVAIEPASGPSADPTSVEDSAPSAEPVAPAQPVSIEIWRMGRPERPKQGERRPRGEFRADGQKRGDGLNPAGQRPWHLAPRPGSRPDAAVAAAPGPSAPEGAPAETPNSETPRRHNEARKERREQFGKFAERKPDRPQGEGRGDRPFGQKPHRGDGRKDRPERDPDRQRGSEHRAYPIAIAGPRKPAEKVADPDSPFAKLAALKAALESKK